MYRTKRARCMAQIAKLDVNHAMVELTNDAFATFS